MQRYSLVYVILAALVIFAAGFYLGRSNFRFSFGFLHGSSSVTPVASAPSSASSTLPVPAPACLGSTDGLPFTFTIHSGLPQYSFQLFTVNDAATQQPEVNCIEVLTGSSTSPSQTLTDFPSSPLLGAVPINDVLQTRDVNFDGYQDLQLAASAGATGNVSYDFWLFDPAAKTFVFNEGLSSLLSPVFNGQSKQITSHLDNGCAGACYEDDTYAFQNGNLTLIQVVTQTESDDQTSFTRTTKILSNGQMQTVNEETIPLSQINQQ